HDYPYRTCLAGTVRCCHGHGAVAGGWLAADDILLRDYLRIRLEGTTDHHRRRCGTHHANRLVQLPRRDFNSAVANTQEGDLTRETSVGSIRSRSFRAGPLTTVPRQVNREP